jgi:hypothetical protein
MSTERLCQNVKSRKFPNVQCPFVATHTDFCHRHYKNPLRFISKKTECDHVHTRKEHAVAAKIQIFWKKRLPSHKAHIHGPSFFEKSISQNETEIYSLESIQNIPEHYYFSFIDSKKSCWTFDLRSLNHLLLEDIQLRNPYTREPLTEIHLERIKQQIRKLTAQKLPIFYPVKENLNNKQLWNEKVLSSFLKLDALGYRASPQWFESMTFIDHERFYKYLYILWSYRLGLTSQEKEAIVPGSVGNRTRLFRWNPDQVQGGQYDLQWWRKQNLEIIRRFIDTSEDKTKKALGALYVIIGFTYISKSASEAYPWVVESIPS